MVDNSLHIQEPVMTLEDVLAYCMLDLKQFCGTLFPDIFYAEFSQLHQQIFDLVNHTYNGVVSKKKQIAIAAPRGIGKTSIARALAMRAILFHTTSFIMYVSNSATSAELQTENIKRDLLSNGQVKALFGNIKHQIDSVNVVDESFSKMAWTAYGTSFILPRGAGQQVRGLNWNNHRPGLIIIDDLEEKDALMNPDNRNKLKEWFYSDLLKTEGRYSTEDTIIVYIDTIKHEDSLLVDLIESPEWYSIQLSICDENYKTLDPNYMTDEEIAAEVAEHRRMGTLDSFYMERMNVPISKEDQVFKATSFKYYKDNFSSVQVVDREGKAEPESEPISSHSLTHVTLVDPARTVKLQSADSAIITIGIDRQSHGLFVREPFSGKLYPDELYDEMFRQVKMYKSFLLGVDVIGLSNFVTQPIESEMRIRGVHPLLVELPAKRSKEERVATLAPLFRQGYIYFNNSGCCGKLEQQLLGFPRSKLWDLMDCLAYITFIMDKYAIYFDPMDEDGEGEFAEDAEDFDSLTDQPALTSNQMGLII